MTRAKEIESHPSAAAQSVLHEFKEGLGYILKTPFLRQLVPLALLINFVVTPLSVMDVAWVRQVLHRGPVSYGFFGMAILAGMIVGGLSLGTIRKWATFPVLISVGLALTGIALAGMTLVINFYANLAALLIAGTGFGAVGALVGTRVILSTPDSLRGRVSGTLNALITALVPCGLALAGWASGPLGLPWLFRISGLVLLALAVVFFRPESPPDTERISQSA